jgi:uncharacterized membrane protein YidH (DUF202 family)
MSVGSGSGDQRRTDLAGERTVLALERTVLAWWRTALASLAVALAVGRLLPELTESDTTWPYVALGIAFAAYSTGLFAYGAVRSRGLPHGTSRPFVAAAAFGALLALATLVVVAAG